jgi:hypothetical protein
MTSQGFHLRIRFSLLRWRSLVEILNQSQPVFEPLPAARTNRQMLFPFRQKKFVHIKGKGADLVVRVAGKVLLLKRRSGRRELSTVAGI